MKRGINIVFNNSDDALRYLTIFVKSFLKDKPTYIPLFDTLLINDTENDIFYNSIIYEYDKLISLLSVTYQLMFLELFAFYQETSSFMISDFNDFSNSNYNIAIFCADSVYFDIYIKDEQVLSEAYELALKTSFTQLEWITDENDARTSFSVL